VTQIFQQVVWQLFALLLGFFIGGTAVVSTVRFRERNNSSVFFLYITVLKTTPPFYGILQLVDVDRDPNKLMYLMVNMG
jgi:hypothetical protein